MVPGSDRARMLWQLLRVLQAAEGNVILEGTGVQVLSLVSSPPVAPLYSAPILPIGTKGIQSPCCDCLDTGLAQDSVLWDYFLFFFGLGSYLTVLGSSGVSQTGVPSPPGRHSAVPGSNLGPGTCQICVPASM